MTSIFRFQEESTFVNDDRKDSIDTYWDTDFDLKDTGGWETRHMYESQIISSIITEFNLNSALELGSGPGNLGNNIQQQTNIQYTMVDGESAQRAHTRRQHSGTFIVQDLFDGIDCAPFGVYDLVIINDFLEHIRNPSAIMEAVRKQLTHDSSYLFISTPNWRMKHHFFYPGLFDFDNFIKFIKQEGFSIIRQYNSWGCHVPIRTPRLSSELLVQDNHLYDWNYYLLFEKIK